MIPWLTRANARAAADGSDNLPHNQGFRGRSKVTLRRGYEKNHAVGYVIATNCMAMITPETAPTQPEKAFRVDRFFISGFFQVEPQG